MSYADVSPEIPLDCVAASIAALIWQGGRKEGKKIAMHRQSRFNVVWRCLAVSVLILTALGASWQFTPPVMALENYGPWRAEYFDNQNLMGAPKLVRTDNFIDFGWNLDSPDPSIPNEHFSVRWTGFIHFAGGTYRFTVVTDDGVRLWIDEQPVLDKWQVQPETRYEVPITLAAGYHYVRMEYFDNTDRAVAKMFWERVDGAAPVPTSAFRGEYFGNRWLSGAPVLVRQDAEINFNWGYGAPDAALPADCFSVRWTRELFFNAGNYTFFSRTDDGVRVWVDSTLVIDRWFDQSATTTASKAIYISQGNHAVRVEYYENTGVASAQVWWQAGGVIPTPVTPVPPAVTEVIVDDLSSGFSRSGPPSGWFQASIGYGGHMFYTYNSVYQVLNAVTWTPKLSTAGYYDVYAFIPRNYADTRAARYRVFHNGQRDDAVIAQALYFDQWVKLGTFYFHAGGGEYVYLADNTGEAYASKRLGFDAIKFVLKGAVTPPTPVPPPPPVCAIMPQAGFGNIWNNNATVRSRLGCALAPEQSLWSAEQGFQGGYLFWRSDTRTIYALYSNGTWQSFADTWDESQPASDPSLIPPPGFSQPVRGFGKIWREQAEARGRLGWATEAERGLFAAIEPFQNGLMIWSNAKGTFVIYNDGTWQLFR